MITGETGAGKTMVVTALGLLLGGRADTGAVRNGAGPRRVEGVVGATGLAGLRRRGRGGRRRGRGRPRGPGPQRLRRGPVPRVRRRRVGARVPARRRSPSRWWRCTASPTSTGCCGRRAARGARPLRRRRGACAAGRLHRAARRLRATERELADVVATARERAREADLLRFGLERDRGRRPRAGRGRALAAEEARLGFADKLRTAAEQAREALSSEHGEPRRPRRGLGGARPPRRRPRARHRGRRARRPVGRDHLPALRRRRPTWRPTPPARDRPGAAGRRVRAPGGADRADPQVRRDHRRGAGLGGAASAARLLELDGTDERIEELRAEPALRAELGDLAAAAVGRPQRGRGAAGRRGHRRARLLAMPHARVEVAVTQHEAEAGRRRGGSPLWSATGGSGSPPPASTTSSSCWPPTPAPSPGRCTRAPPAASCPG